MDYKRVSNDINGNPRYVFHYVNFLSEADEKRFPLTVAPVFKVCDNLKSRYRLAVNKAKKIGGKKYRGSDFGGGIVVQTSDVDKIVTRIKELSKD